MQRREFLVHAGAALGTVAILPAFAQPLQGLESVMPNTKSGFAPVNGLEMYYEIHGEGEPLILLHGGVQASEAFGPNLPALAKLQQVIAVHLQGHGHTKDIDRPLRFESMADDIAALIAYLKLGKADLLGYSLGGGVALQTVIRPMKLSAAASAMLDRMDLYARQRGSVSCRERRTTTSSPQRWLQRWCCPFSLRTNPSQNEATPKLHIRRMPLNVQRRLAVCAVSARKSPEHLRRNSYSQQDR